MDDLFMTIRQVDQYSKMAETKILDEMNSTNNNLELLKEKSRLDNTAIED